jgi:hypothetical protein
MTVEDIQIEFKKLKIQWLEHIFNDDKLEYGDCFLKVTKDTSPNAFSNYNEKIYGWGRFSREYCWQQAYEWLNKLEKV